MAEPHVCAPIDANGNLTSDGTKTYFWNALNQLVEVKEGTTSIATFEYDGGGRRTEKVVAGITRTYIYDAEDIVEERISGTSSDTIRYYHGAGIDEALARKNSSAVVTYYLADHLGSIVQESSAAGVITLEREYDPWGVATQGGSTSGYAFTGREWDAEIGLYFYRARYYRADSGRFIGLDPIGLRGGINLYGYVGNRPGRFIDPLGLCSEEQEQSQDKQKPENRLDAAYRRLANRQQRTVLDEVGDQAPDQMRRVIRETAITGGLVATGSGAGRLLLNPAVINTLYDAALMTTTMVETLAPGAWNRGTDAVQGFPPSPPSTVYQYIVNLTYEISSRLLNRWETEKEDDLCAEGLLPVVSLAHHEIGHSHSGKFRVSNMQPTACRG